MADKPDKQAKQYRPNKAAKELLARISDDWELAYNQRTRNWRHLGDTNLEAFWRRSRDHYNGYSPAPESTTGEWKSRAFKKKTRHKVIATVAQFVRSGLGVDFAAFDKADRLDRDMSRVIEDIYDWSAERENLDYTKLMAYLEMVISGTAHWLDEIAWDSRMVKEIIDVDFETGEVKWEEKERTDFKGCRSELVPNEEMFPGDAWTRDIQKQPFLIRRRLTTEANAKVALSRFKNWQYVEGGTRNFLSAVVGSEADQADSSDRDDEVEILHYWSKEDDLFAIVANGVLMTMPDNPIPYPHKQYPFAKDVLETFADSRFYWGDSLPNKNYDDQEITNALWRLFIDSTKLKNKPPLFTNNLELANTDLIVPGTIVQKGMQDTVEALEAISQGVTQSEFKMLELTEHQIDENSIDPLVSAQSPQGDPTATQVRAIVGAAETMKGVNEQYISNLLVQHAAIRVPNLLWFLTHDEEYQRVVLDDVKTGSGKRGKRQIFFQHKADLPKSPEDVMTLEQKSEEQSGEPVDLVFVDKDSVNDYRFHVSMSAVPKDKKRTNSATLAKAMTKYQLYAQNPVFDQRVNGSMLAEAMGDDPDEVLGPEPLPGMGMGMPGQVPAQPAEMAQMMGPMGA